MVLREVDKVISEIELLKKMDSPRVAMEFGRVIRSSFEHELKAFFPIVVTDVGMVTVWTSVCRKQ